MRRYFFTLLIIPALIAGACSRKPTPGLTPEMRDAYKAVSSLFGYVWAPAMFDDPANEKEITTLLDRLADDFHRVENKASDAMFEPGFTTSLFTQRQSLKDISKRFKSGQKEYANWKLRGLSANCIACHSRFNAPIDFLGAPPQPVAGDFEAQMALAQFLFASRQFEKASDSLMRLAKSVGRADSGSAYAFRALELWLVIEVRVKDRPAAAVEDLEDVLEEIKFADYEQQAVRSWIAELKELESRPAFTVDPLTEAQGLLNPVLEANSEDSDNAHLVKTLKASALLHVQLQGMPRSDRRRKAAYLLGLSYAHLPIQVFQGFREQYLEQVIREFPASEEAKRSFVIYEDLIETENSGSGGLHLDKEQVRELKELRNLAYGMDQTPAPDPKANVL